MRKNSLTSFKSSNVIKEEPSDTFIIEQEKLIIKSLVKNSFGQAIFYLIFKVIRSFL